MAAVETTALLSGRRSAVVSTAGTRASSPECCQGGEVEIRRRSCLRHVRFRSFCRANPQRLPRNLEKETLVLNELVQRLDRVAHRNTRQLHRIFAARTSIGTPHVSVEPATFDLHGELVDEEIVAKSGNRTIELEFLAAIV